MAGELVKIEHAAPTQRRSFDEIMRMAETIAKSRLFGVTQVDQVVALMLMAEAEGRHVASAMQDYSVIQGKPSLKAEAMLARFQQAGGKVKWTCLTDERVAAIFSHAQCEPVEIDWDMARAKQAQLANPMWKKYPRQMLRARVISEGVRTAYPGALGGMYAPEEVIDFEPSAVQSRAPAPAIAHAREAEAVVDYVEEAPPSKPAAPVQTMSKGAARGDYGVMVEEMRRITSSRDLKEWGRMNAERVKLQPKDWQGEIRKSYQELMEGLQYAEQASAEAEEELEDAR
jgi:hypothetical protein